MLAKEERTLEHTPLLIDGSGPQASLLSAPCGGSSSRKSNSSNAAAAADDDDDDAATTKRRRRRMAAVAGSALLLCLAAVVGVLAKGKNTFRPPPATDASSYGAADTATTSVTTLPASSASSSSVSASSSSSSSASKTAVQQEMLTTFNVVTSWEAGRYITCEGSSFAYCGHATCHSVNNKTALCGCVLEEGQTGQFSFSKASLVLLQSHEYRKAVLQIAADAFTAADNAAFCAGLNDGSIFAAAGYDSDYGSFYLSSSRRLSATKTAAAEVLPPPPPAATAAATAFSSSASLVSANDFSGSCMGAPCKTYEWGGDCGLVCACTDFPDTDDESDSMNNAADGCFFNGVLDEERTYQWTENLEMLMDFIDSVRHTVSNVPTIAQDLVAISKDSAICAATCSVESPSEDPNDTADGPAPAIKPN